MAKGVTFFFVAVLFGVVHGHFYRPWKVPSSALVPLSKSVNDYAQLFVNSVDSIKSVLKTYEGVSLVSQRAVEITGNKYKLNGNIYDLKCFGISNFAITEIKPYTLSHYVDVTISIPRVLVSAKYDVAGYAKKKTVNGQGELQIAINNIKINARVQFKMLPTPQVYRIDVLNNVQTVQFNGIGLKVTGLCKRRVNFAAARFLLAKSRSSSVRINQLLATSSLQLINALFKGQSLAPTLGVYLNHYAKLVWQI